MASKGDLYEREIQRYRETLKLDVDMAQDRYGVTLLHSLPTSDRVLALRDMGNEITNPVDFYNLGHRYAADEDWDEAIKYFRRAIELEPTLTDAIYNLAVCYESASLLPQAKSTWQAYHDAIFEQDEREAVKEHIAQLGI